MKSILLPTDFSPSSFNAAKYALKLANQLSFQTLILYNAYMPLINDNPSMPDIITADNAGVTNFIATDIDEFKKTSETELNNFKENIQKENTSNIEIKTVSDYNEINTGILEATATYNAAIVIMPVANVHDKIDEILMGNDYLDVVKESKVPVIIVPVNAQFTQLKKILFACDLKMVSATTPVSSISEMLDITKAEFYVLHVEANANDFNPEMATETLALDNLLGNYNPQYAFTANKNFAEAIDKFALENNIDLIITIPKKYGWFESIFKPSQTKDLVFHTHIPLMTIHAKS